MPKKVPFGYESKYGHGHILCGGCANQDVFLTESHAVMCCKCCSILEPGRRYTVPCGDDMLVCGRAAYEKING